MEELKVIFKKKNLKNLSKIKFKVISPLWNTEPEKYMNDLLDSNFDFIMTSVSSDGLR